MKIGMWGVMSQVGVMWCGAGHLRTFPRTYLHLPAHARLVFPPIPSLLRHDQVSDQNSSDANKKYMRGRTAAAADGWMDAAADGEMDGVIEIMMCDWQTWRVSDRDGCRAGSRRDSRAVQT